MTPDRLIVAAITGETAHFVNVLAMIMQSRIALLKLPFTIGHPSWPKEGILLTKAYIPFPDLGVTTTAIGERTERRHRHIEGIFLYIVILMPPLKG